MTGVAESYADRPRMVTQSATTPGVISIRSQSLPVVSPFDVPARCFSITYSQALTAVFGSFR